MTKLKTWWLLYVLLVTMAVSAQSSMGGYNVVWTSPSKNASESMPCGGGDIGMNVWVENGELLVYIARSGNFDENNALFKTGRLRVQLSPNIFNGKIFKQELHLQEGYITVAGENNGVKGSVKIWADVHHPVIYINISGNKKISAQVAYESWRYKDRIVTNKENAANSWKWGGKNILYKRDSIRFESNSVVFYHQNTLATVFDTTVEREGMGAVKDQLYNPLEGLIFGGLLEGAGFVPAGTNDGQYAKTDYRGWQLKSIRPAKEHSLRLILHNEQSSLQDWEKALYFKKLLVSKVLQRETTDWWRKFWQRSFINIDQTKTDSIAWQVGRNYQLFRYMLGCNANSEWPTKFNGGLFTVDPVFTDPQNTGTPDFRNWGGGTHTAQNQRLVYFPMIRSGDWDVMQAQLKFYLRLQKNAELRSSFYWGHAGACFTEQMENFGLPNMMEYGAKRPAYFDKGVEYNAWLEYEWDTVFEFCLMMLEEAEYTGRDISDRIPFIESCLRFFDEHYQYLATRRGIKPLDANGKLILFPGSAGETYKMANNASSTIAALSTVAKKLLAASQSDFYRLPYDKPALAEPDLVKARRLKWLTGFIDRIPELPFRFFGDKVLIAPAKTWERINNVESMQLYPVYPWGIFGVGKPGLDTALNTWRYDTSAVKFRSHKGWKQDNIWAARLGLVQDAWHYTSLKLKDSERRFPAFWGPGFDWVPDHNWGGSGMIGLQEMLLQTNGKEILLFPAWPKEKDVHFKLYAPYNTTVEAILKKGELVSLIVLPKEREKDVINLQR